MSTKASTNEHMDRTTISKGILKWILVNTLVILALGSGMFFAAGRLDWGLGWLYLGIVLTGQIATTLILLPTNPALLAERAWMQKGSKAWDTVIVGLSDAGWFLVLSVAGGDVRFGWSPQIPDAFVATGFLLLIAGYLLFLLAMASNRFFSSFVRIQTERGHSVQTGGPYRYVRHPGYVGGILMFTGTPFALASLWAFIPAGLLLALYILRTGLEDRTLQAELEGYVNYCKQVRYRLLPGIW